MKIETDKASSRGGDAASNHLKIHRVVKGHAMEGSNGNAAAVRGCLIAEILGTASDAIIATDVDERITFWNPGATRIFDFTSGEIVRSSLDFIIPDVRARHWAGYTRLATGESHCGQSDRLSVPALTKDGRRISVEFTIVLSRDELGESVGAAGIVRDATKCFEEIREMQRLLTKSGHSLASPNITSAFPSAKVRV